jgi:hypothetical protein
VTVAKKPDSDAAAQEAVEGRDKSGPKNGSDGDHGKRPPTAGPHAEPSLVNPEATPGAGTVPPAGERDNGDATSG